VKAEAVLGDLAAGLEGEQFAVPGLEVGSLADILPYPRLTRTRAPPVMPSLARDPAADTANRAMVSE
jgi:hypothetical protein